MSRLVRAVDALAQGSTKSVGPTVEWRSQQAAQIPGLKVRSLERAVVDGHDDRSPNGRVQRKRFELCLPGMGRHQRSDASMGAVANPASTMGGNYQA